ncbi:MAG TPA: hydrogenase [Clostridiales bacterium]|nr:hydrogenase [Clostridiales bacterium]
MLSPVSVLNFLVILGIVLCAILAAGFKKNLPSILALAGCGAFTSLEFILLHAPDVAIAEASVGVVITTIIFVVTLQKTGGENEK